MPRAAIQAAAEPISPEDEAEAMDLLAQGLTGREVAQRTLLPLGIVAEWAARFRAGAESRA